jgi:hypothetical protein
MVGTDATLSIPDDPGTYHVAVLTGGLDTVADNIGGKGDDHYLLVLRPAQPARLR